MRKRIRKEGMIVARQMVVDRFVGTAGDLAWRSERVRDRLRTGRERYLDVPAAAKRWEELTGAAYACDAPAFSGECEVCGGCGR